MNVNFGLFPPIEMPKVPRVEGKRLRGAEKTAVKKQALAMRALADAKAWFATL